MPSDAMEEKYLRLRDDHTALKKKSNEQQDTIKRMYTKLAMIEENLKRKDRGDAIPSPAKVGGGARNAEAERLVVDLRKENKELKKKCTLLTAKCRKFAVQLKKRQAAPPQEAKAVAALSPADLVKQASGRRKRKSKASSAEDALQQLDDLKHAV